MFESVYCPRNSSSFSLSHLPELQADLQLLTDFYKGINEFDIHTNQKVSYPLAALGKDQYLSIILIMLQGQLKLMELHHGLIETS